MKKIWLVTLCTLLIGSILCACSSILGSSNLPMEVTENNVRFDLDQYVEHGELSCDRIWVIKEESSWDSEPQRYFAYLTSDGNVIYGWHLMGTFTHPTMDGVFYPNTFTLGDFSNGYAMLYDRSTIDKGGFAKATVINENGSEVANFMIRASYSNRGGFQIDYVDFNSNGYAFFVGKLNYKDSYGMYFINSSGVHKFQCKDEDVSFNALSGADILGDKYMYLPEPNYQLYNRSGQLLADLGRNCQIEPDNISVIDDTYIEATFTGNDDKQYMCILDFYGNMLTEPVQRSAYRRNVVNLDKPSAEQAAYMPYIGTWRLGGLWHDSTPRFIVNENLTWCYRNGYGIVADGTAKISDEGLELYDVEGELLGLIIKESNSAIRVEVYSWKLSDVRGRGNFIRNNS